MTSKLKRILTVFAVLFGMIITAGIMTVPASASTCTASTANSSCGPYAYQPQITSAGGSDTYVNNNVWNPPPGFTGQLCQAGSAVPCETTTATDPGHWTSTANFTSQGGAVLSYPDTQQLYSENTIDNYSSLTSSFTENLGSNSNTTAEAAYDIWANNWSNEIMVWVDTTPSQAVALNYDTNLGTFTISGQTWTIYRNGSELIVYRNTNEQTGTVDIKTTFAFLESHGWLPASSKLTAIDFGPEFVSTGGQFETYTQSCFTISENVPDQSCGGTTPTPTPTPTSTSPTPTPTPTTTSPTPTPTPTSTSYSVWNDTGTPSGSAESNDPNAQTTGLKFKANKNGYITGIRFYKEPHNVGTHIGSLWNSTGTKLATGTFSNETASGWQELDFTKPVAITANKVYTASYFSSTGYPAYTHYGLSSAVTNGPLTALSNGGVYAYGSSEMRPTSTYLSSNYWVDVIYHS